jgi:L-ascorbate metabolism protein UlaG (beta-lactamase superfamily)
VHVATGVDRDRGPHKVPCVESTKRLVLPADSALSTPGRGSIFFVGTATVVLRYAGFTLLTDPNFLHMGDHVHLGYGVFAERRTDPAIELEDLPRTDLVVLSHLHEDHFDRVVAQRLDRLTPIVTTPHATSRLREIGFRAAHELSTWGALEVAKGDARLRITAMPGRHGPRVVSALLPPVMGSMLEIQGPGDPELRLYISGDTLVNDELERIPRRFPDLHLALLHLGGTRVFGVLVTMDAKQGVRALQIVRPRLGIPIHYDDYTVFKSPLSDFVAAVRGAGLEPHVKYLDRGETFTFDVAELTQLAQVPRADGR